MNNIILENVDDDEMFIRCVNTLISKTAVLSERDGKAFDFLKRERNLAAVRSFFLAAGWEIYFNEDFGICMRLPSETLQEMPGVLRDAKVPLSLDDVILIAVLNQMFTSNLSSMKENYITQAQLIRRLKEMDFDIGKSRLLESLLKLKKNSFLTFDESKKADENMRIDLYSTLRFSWDEESVRRIAEEILETA